MKRVFLLCLCLCLFWSFPALADVTESALGSGSEYDVMPLADDDGGSGGNLYFWKYEREDGEPYREDWASSFTEPVYAYYVMQGTKYQAVYLSRSYFEISCNYGYRGDGTWNLSNSLSKSIVKTSSSGSSVYYFGVVYSGNYFKGAPLDTSNSAQSLIDKFAAGEIGKDDPSGGGSGTSVVFDSLIPTPQNFRCYTKKGNWSGINYNQGAPYALAWSNSSATDYGILLSANVKVKSEGKSYTVEFESSNQDAVYGAWRNEYIPDWQKIKDKYSNLSGLVFPTEFYPTSFTLQFYTVVEGVIHVGNKARCVLTVDSNGHLFGSTTETVNLDKDMNETIDSSNTITSDVDGNITSTGGSAQDKVESFTDWLNSFLSIPSVLNQFFMSLRDMMSGIGDVPALIGDMFSALPAGILTIMGIGVTLVVVLRIFGR